MTAQELIDQGYYQISRKFYILAKLPEGKTGKEALYEASLKTYEGLDNYDFWVKDTRRWVDGLGEANSTDQYLRVHADCITVTKEVFEEFRRLGGRTAR